MAKFLSQIAPGAVLHVFIAGLIGAFVLRAAAYWIEKLHIRFLSAFKMAVTVKAIQLFPAILSVFLVKLYSTSPTMVTTTILVSFYLHFEILSFVIRRAQRLSVRSGNMIAGLTMLIEIVIGSVFVLAALAVLTWT